MGMTTFVLDSNGRKIRNWHLRLNPNQPCSLFVKHFSFELCFSKGCELHTVKLVWRTNRLVHRWPAPQYSIYVSTMVLDHGTVKDVQLYSTARHTCVRHNCCSTVLWNIFQHIIQYGYNASALKTPAAKGESTVVCQPLLCCRACILSDKPFQKLFVDFWLTAVTL